jgi:polyhydroxyalkanoate synthesis regulator phasin
MLISIRFVAAGDDFLRSRAAGINNGGIGNPSAGARPPPALHLLSRRHCTAQKLGYTPIAMIDIIKKTLLAGVGAAVITKDKVESALGDFVKQGKVTSAEARAMAEKIAEDGRREFENLSHELSEKFASIVPQTQQRLDALEARVAALERAAAAAASEAADKLEPAPGE